MFLKTIIVTLFFTWYLLNPTNTLASNDILITCTQKSCSTNSKKSFFSADNFYPGQTLSQKIIVNNTRKDYCSLILVNFKNTNTNELPEQLILNLSTQNDQIYSGTLNTLFAKNQTEPLILPPKQKTALIWSIKFNKEASNIYQGSSLKFNFEMNFICDGELNKIFLSTIDNKPKVLGLQTTNEDIRNLITPIRKQNGFIRDIFQNIKRVWYILLLLQILLQFAEIKISHKLIKEIFLISTSIIFLITFLTMDNYLTAILSFIIGIYFLNKSSVK